VITPIVYPDRTGYSVVYAIERMAEQMKTAVGGAAPDIARKEFDSKMKGWKEGPTQ
jgi:hypothetical protein